MKQIPVEYFGGCRPSEVNRNLFLIDTEQVFPIPFYVTQNGTKVFSGGHHYDGKRKYFSVVMENSNVPYRWVQGFYVSTGRNTPDTSPSGTVWPCGPIVSQDVVLYPNESERRGLYRKGMGVGFGWITKAIFVPKGTCPEEGVWSLHGKEKDHIPSGLYEVCQFIQSML